MNLFEIATREKYRFPYKGMISVEDLWDLTPAQLDGIYKALNKDVKVKDEDSLLAENRADATLTNMIEIVKYIFAAKQNEAAARRAAADKAKKKARIMEILAKKQDDSLQNMSEADLLKMLDELD